jgi:UDP-N-acetylmuramate--alanine ligase
VKECWPDRRLIVLFQPHRYTRTRDLYDRFVKSFYQADLLMVTPIYSAGEVPMEGVTGEWLVQGIREHGHKEVAYHGSQDEALDAVLSVVREGDLVMTLGAGDIYRAGERLMDRLGKRGPGPISGGRD